MFRLTAPKRAKGTAHPIYNLHIMSLTLMDFYLQKKMKKNVIPIKAAVTVDVNNVHYQQ